MNDLKRYENLSQVHGTMQKHPTMEWSYHRDDPYQWKGSVAGIVYLEVGAVAVPAPKYDGDDDTFRTEYRYRSGEIAIHAPFSIGG